MKTPAATKITAERMDRQMSHKIIAVYGNSGSYKTATSISLAHYISAADSSANVALVCVDNTKPLLPIIASNERSFSGSLGKVLSVVDFNRDIILKNMYMAGRIGVLAYNVRENANTYAIASQERIDDLYMQLRHLADYTIIDCTSDVAASRLTAKAIINADITVELLSCDLNGLVFDGSQEPILQSEQYGYRDFIRMISLSEDFKQDEAAMQNALGRITGKIPYSRNAAEYFNQGVLLSNGVDDRNYTSSIKSLIKLLTKEDDL